MSMAQQEFGARLKRINAGKTSAWTVPGEGLAAYGQEVRLTAGAKMQTRVRKKGGLLALPIAVVTAILAVIAGHWLSYAYLVPGGPVPVEYLEMAQEMAGPFLTQNAAALVLGGLFILLFGQTTKLRLLVFGAVFAGTLFNEHELVHLAPDAFGMIYPAGWVQSMLAIPSQLPI